MNRPNQPEAGPSRLRHNEPYRVPVPEDVASDPSVEYITIPSIGTSPPLSQYPTRTNVKGLEYYEYRRALFLAGCEPKPLPTPRPEYIIVQKPPPPIPYDPKPMMVESGRFRNQAAGMVLLEKQLDKPRSKQNAFTKARVREVEDYLRSGKKLVKGTTLSFIVSPSLYISKHEADG
jgi:hypothetical protein